MRRIAMPYYFAIMHLKTEGVSKYGETYKRQHTLTNSMNEL